MQILKYLAKIPSRHYFKHHVREIEFCCVYGIENWLVFYPIKCIVFLHHLAITDLNTFFSLLGLNTISLHLPGLGSIDRSIFIIKGAMLKNATVNNHQLKG